MTITHGLGQYARAALNVAAGYDRARTIKWCATLSGTYTAFASTDEVIFRHDETLEDHDETGERTSTRGVLLTCLDAQALTVDHFVEVDGTKYAVTSVGGEHVRRYDLERMPSQSHGNQGGDE